MSQGIDHDIYFYILKQNGEVYFRNNVVPLIDDDNNSEPIKVWKQKYTEEVHNTIGDYKNVYTNHSFYIERK